MSNPALTTPLPAPTACTLNAILAMTIKKLRISKGLTQEALAGLAGIDRAHLSLLERNKRSMTISTLECLIPHLSVNTLKFFDRLNLEILDACRLKISSGKCFLLGDTNECTLRDEKLSAFQKIDSFFDLSRFLDSEISKICIFNEQGQVIHLNTEFLRFLNLSLDDVRNKYVWELSKEDSLKKKLMNELKLITSDSFIKRTLELNCMQVELTFLISPFEIAHFKTRYFIANSSS